MKTILTALMILNSVAVYGASFPLPCMIMTDHLVTPVQGTVFQTFNTWDSVNKTFCPITYLYTPSNGQTAETSAGVRAMALSIGADGEIVRVQLDYNCYSSEIQAQVTLYAYRKSGICK